MALSADELADKLSKVHRAQGLSDDTLWDALRTCSDASALAALQEFGELLITEAQTRTSALDSKSTSLLGWNAAAAAVFLAALPQMPMTLLATWLVLVGAALSASGAVTAYLALRVRGFHVPSQLDWFDMQRCHDVLALRRGHILAIKRWHDADAHALRAKAFWATWAQRALVCTAGVLVCALLLAVLPRL